METVASHAKPQAFHQASTFPTNSSRGRSSYTNRSASLSSRSAAFGSRLSAALASSGKARARTLSASAAKIVAVSSTPKQHPGPVEDFDWDNLEFGLTETTAMYVATCKGLDGEWSGSLQPFGNVSVSPAAAVLNYGQGIFEGMKAYRTDKDRICVFRPDKNAARMADGAVRMSMPPVPAEFFKQAVLDVVAANAHWIPEQSVGSLYIRPLLIGSGPILGVAPAPEFTFLIYVSPVAAYFKGGQLSPIDLFVETEGVHRAAPGGTGGVKAIGNYSQMIQNGLKRKAEGYADVVYLDSREGKYVEEVSTCNLFVVKGNTIATSLTGETVLPGITRRSVIELAEHLGYTVEERQVAAEELMEADEIFTTGTAVVIMPVGSVTYQGTKKEFHGGNVGPVASQIYKGITDIQLEKAEDPFGWVCEVPPQ